MTKSTSVDAGSDSQRVKSAQVFNQQIWLFHGDKGGVGKSFTCHAFVDYQLSANVPVAVLDADTRNPDVFRVFNGKVDCAQVNLRRDDGWMDVIDFIKAHPSQHVAVSLPAGIGESMQKEFVDFCRFIKLKVAGSPQVVLFWVINLFADSVNLLKDSLDSLGSHVSKTVVVRNLVFGEQNAFFLWDESPLRAELESKNTCTTISLPALHLRVTTKLFASDEVLTFSRAAAMPAFANLTPAEQFKLETWITEDVKAPFDRVATFLTS